MDDKLHHQALATWNPLTIKPQKVFTKPAKLRTFDISRVSHLGQSEVVGGNILKKILVGRKPSEVFIVHTSYIYYIPYLSKDPVKLGRLLVLTILLGFNVFLYDQLQ